MSLGTGAKSDAVTVSERALARCFGAGGFAGDLSSKMGRRSADSLAAKLLGVCDRATGVADADATVLGEMSRQSRDERALLREAVRLATANAERGEQPFAALIVLDGLVAGTGVSTILSGGDPTAHAEVAAVRDACRSLGTLELGGATMVCSCEPCPMCHATAIIAGVSRIVYAAPKELAARYGFALIGVAADMQATWRARQLDPVEHVPIEGAEQPFARFDEGTRP